MKVGGERTKKRVAARRLLRLIEKKLEEDWQYADFPREAKRDIQQLAKALRDVLGPDEPDDAMVQGPGGTHVT